MVALLIIIVFVALAYLMYAGHLPALVALPLLAFLITIVAGLPHHWNLASNETSQIARGYIAVSNTVDLLLKQVVGKGIFRLHVAILTVMLGGLFGQLVRRTGVADTLVRRVAELAGDNAFSVSFILILACAFLFTSLGGLGAVILVASIVFPVMLSLSVPPLLCACLFLIAMCFGGVFNLVNWQFYMDLLELPASEICRFAIPFGVLYLAMAVAFLSIALKRESLAVPTRALAGVMATVVALGATLWYFECSILALGSLIPNWVRSLVAITVALGFVLPARGTAEKPSTLALISPFVPIALVILLGVDIAAAFIIGSLLLLRATKVDRGRIRMLIQCTIEGIESVAPAVALMMGIGMVLIAVTRAPVSQALQPVLTALLPTSTIGYVLFFGLLAPLALYRGPLNMWGMGSGLLKLLQQAAVLSPLHIVAAFLSTGQIQGVCDPTNTHNVWIANHLKVDLRDILAKTLPYMWALAVAGLVLGSVVAPA